MQYKLSIEELCRKLKPIFGKRIDELYMRYTMAETKEEKEELTQMFSILYNKNLNRLLDDKVLLEPPDENILDGDYVLADVNYADKKLFPFTLREQDWIRHMCISGMSGSGKTTFAFHIIENFIKKQKPFLIFDWKKSFRPLILIDPEIRCFTIGNDSVTNSFKTNINQPPKGVSPKEWINILCDLLTESFFVSYGVHKVLLETLDEAFKEWGIYSGSENYPTWNHIKWRLEEKLDKTRGRESGWIESALRIATVLTFGDFGKICNYKGEGSLKVEDLFDKKVIFELNSLGNIEKKFFCEFILTYIYKLKKARQENVNSNFDYAILVDEAHNIFLKENTNFAKESVTDMVYREMREYGISLICLDQHISKLSDTVKGNSACHVAFQQQLPQDIWDISGLMNLKEKRNFFSMLPVGSAIVKLSERYNSPFLVEVSQVDLRNKNVSNQDIIDRMKFISMQKFVEDEKDPEFNKALIPTQVLEKTEMIEELNLQKILGDSGLKNLREKIKEKPFAKEIVEDKQEKKNLVFNNFTPAQKILSDFVEKKLDNGGDILELERLMLIKENMFEGKYNVFDVLKVINYALERKLNFSKENVTTNFNESVTTLEKQNNRKVYKEKKTNQIDKFNDQEKFLSFLRENPNHDYSTVNLYKKLKLSARKGNKIKNELLRKNLIKIQEQKNNKGWKKIIRIN